MNAEQFDIKIHAVEGGVTAAAEAASLNASTEPLAFTEKVPA